MTVVQLPRICIVTPSLNQAQFLEACIDSVLSQAYPNLEYVVMDGGSTDGSVEIIRKYERHLSYWQSKPDGGHYAAVAAGFSRTSGEIMAWLNADDKYCPLAFFKVGHIFDQNPTIDWITARPLRWSVAGRSEDVCAEPIDFSRERVVLRGEFRTPWIQQESTFWRRDLWTRAGGGPREDLRLAGDFELWVRFFRHARLHLMETVLSGNRRHDLQRSVRFMDEYLREAETLLAEERARPAPEVSFSMATPINIEPDRFAALLREAGISSALITADELIAEFLRSLVRLTADRKLHLEANRRAEETLLELENERASRLEAICALERQLLESETDRAARLEAIRALERQLLESETDRAARLKAIQTLEAQLLESESDRAARLQVIHTLEKQIADSDVG